MMSESELCHEIIQTCFSKNGRVKQDAENRFRSWGIENGFSGRTSIWEDERVVAQCFIARPTKLFVIRKDDDTSVVVDVSKNMWRRGDRIVRMTYRTSNLPCNLVYYEEYRGKIYFTVGDEMNMKLIRADFPGMLESIVGDARCPMFVGTAASRLLSGSRISTQRMFTARG